MANDTTYRRAPGESTQWEDIQRRLGNFAPAPPVAAPAPWQPAAAEPGSDALAGLGEGEALEALEDATQDDRFLEEYRAKRLAELRAEAAQPRFGRLRPIQRAQFREEVTAASEQAWVVVSLFDKSVPATAQMREAVAQLALAFPLVSFVEMGATDCIEGYPPEQLPALVVYHHGKCEKLLAGRHCFSGSAPSPEGVASVLAALGAVKP